MGGNIVDENCYGPEGLENETERFMPNNGPFEFDGLVHVDEYKV